MISGASVLPVPGISYLTQYGSSPRRERTTASATLRPVPIPLHALEDSEHSAPRKRRRMICSVFVLDKIALRYHIVKRAITNPRTPAAATSRVFRYPEG